MVGTLARVYAAYEAFAEQAPCARRGAKRGNPSTNTRFQDAQNYVIPRRDPLVLDLDGDGIELIAANGTVLFDHNADGIKTGTGWFGPMMVCWCAT